MTVISDVYFDVAVKLSKWRRHQKIKLSQKFLFNKIRRFTYTLHFWVLEVCFRGGEWGGIQVIQVQFIKIDLCYPCFRATIKQWNQLRLVKSKLGFQNPRTDFENSVIRPVFHGLKHPSNRETVLNLFCSCQIKCQIWDLQNFAKE